MKFIMPLSKKSFWNVLLVLPLLALVVALAGCASQDYSEVMAQPDSGTNVVSAAHLNVGDTITISFDGLPDPLMPQEKTINEDGTITLSDIGTITVVGKSTGEIENIIHDLYVPKIYNHLTVTVKAGDRVYYVRGEVKAPGRQIYVGQITVTKAITSAGDFDDFSNKRNVILTRANGKRFVINCDNILNGDAPDPGVYPGDQIDVQRRMF
jgi:protein involved in polysaccharide export with SLBB domain